MRTLLIALIALAACTRSPGVQPTTPDAANAAAAGLRVEVEHEGGIAALWIRRAVDGDARTYLATTHRICSVPQCQAAVDSAAGPLGAEALQAIAEAARRFELAQLREDYGRTANAADMFVHTVRVQWNGKTRTVRGDDGTLPEAARELSQTVERAISEARK